MVPVFLFKTISSGLVFARSSCFVPLRRHYMLKYLMSFVSFLHPGSSLLSTLLSTLDWSYSCQLDTRSTAVRPLHTLSQFDISVESGFLPNEPPLDRLPPAFDLWESALASANDALSLGEDNSTEAVAKRESSRLWRLQLQNVRLSFIFFTQVLNIILSVPDRLDRVSSRGRALPSASASRTGIPCSFLRALNPSNTSLGTLCCTGVIGCATSCRIGYVGNCPHSHIRGHRSLELASQGFVIASLA